MFQKQAPEDRESPVINENGKRHRNDEEDSAVENGANKENEHKKAKPVAEVSSFEEFGEFVFSFMNRYISHQ